MAVRSIAATGAALCVLLASAWLAGFLWFVHGALRIAPSPAVSADGIVVLTGGADRIAAGLDLLRRNRGRLLLISGVGPGADLARLVRGADAKTLNPRITLGRTATTTIGNAEETAAWARAQNLHTLLVVTAGYHMRRALEEIGRAAPGLALYPAPVTPPAPARLLAHEYTKWLVSALGLTRLGAE